MSFASIEELHKERYEITNKSMKNRFLTESKYLCQSSEDTTIPSFQQLSWSFAGSRLISSAIMSLFQRDEDKHRRIFTSLPGEWISCDNTYKSRLLKTI